jgi:hypothetical protein
MSLFESVSQPEELGRGYKLERENDPVQEKGSDFLIVFVYLTSNVVLSLKVTQTNTYYSLTEILLVHYCLSVEI